MKRSKFSDSQVAFILCQAHAITGTASTNLRFPGQWYQLEAGLHYNWHRHYDPSLGRYTQPDPLGFVDGPSVYAYARSNPLVFVDPRGTDIVGIQGGGTYAPGAGYDINLGIGIDTSTGSVNSFLSRGPAAGIIASADIGAFWFSGDWCDLAGDGFSKTTQIGPFTYTVFGSISGHFGLAFGIGPPIPGLPGGSAAAITNTKVPLSGCGCGSK